MPIRIDNLESGNETPVRPGTNEQHVMEVLTSHPSLAFTPTDLDELADVPKGSINETLSRLDEKGLVRHFELEGVWAAADDLALADYVGSCHSETALGGALEYLVGDWYSEDPDWTADLADLAPVGLQDDDTDSDSK